MDSGGLSEVLPIEIDPSNCENSSVYTWTHASLMQKSPIDTNHIFVSY